MDSYDNDEMLLILDDDLFFIEVSENGMASVQSESNSA